MPAGRGEAADVALTPRAREPRAKQVAD